VEGLTSDKKAQKAYIDRPTRGDEGRKKKGFRLGLR
jgi:hypothetical protein